MLWILNCHGSFPTSRRLLSGRELVNVRNFQKNKYIESNRKPGSTLQTLTKVSFLRLVSCTSLNKRALLSKTGGCTSLIRPWVWPEKNLMFKLVSSNLEQVGGHLRVPTLKVNGAPLPTLEDFTERNGFLSRHPKHRVSKIKSTQHDLLRRAKPSFLRLVSCTSLNKRFF